MTDSNDAFTRLHDTCAASGPHAMLDALAASLRARGRWHALVDVRLLQARLALGLGPTADPGGLAAADRDRFDDLSLAACREAGWPLLEEGEVAAAWMYLRAAATPAAVAERLAPLAAAALAADADDPDLQRRLDEIVGVALWEGVDPALGIDVIFQAQGICPAITAFDQAVARLPAARQAPAAARLVAHLHAEVLANVAADVAARGLAAIPSPTSLVALIDAAGGLADSSIHCDVSHLLAVLRIARVCVEPTTLALAWELARYACRLPPDVSYPGAAPFGSVGEASRLFYGAQLGRDVPEAVDYFTTAAADAARDGAGPLPAETLALVLWRIGRPAEALRVALERPAGDGLPRESLPPGTLPSLVELAAAAGDFEPLRAACREAGDEITFAATLVAEAHQSRGQPLRGAHAAHPPQAPAR